MKKLFLICLAVITCCGCSSTERKNIKNTEWVTTNVGHFKYVEYDGHEYLIWRSTAYAGGITHSPKCPCQNNK